MINYTMPFRRAQNQFSDEERLGMIQEYLTTNVSMRYMCNKYHIGHETIPRWMINFGIPLPDNASDSNVMKKAPEQTASHSSVEELEAQLKALKSELDREKLKNLALSTMIDTAEEELPIDIRKKAGAKQ